MRLLTPIILTIFSFANAKSDLNPLYAELDDKIDSNRLYCELKENRIEALKIRTRQPGIPLDSVYSLNADIYREYRNFVSDSAIVYMNRNLDIAFVLNDSRKINATSNDQALLFSSLGMFKEALDVLGNVDRRHFDRQQTVDYYMACRSIYVGLGIYTQNDRERAGYHRLSGRYSDSLMSVVTQSSEEYLRLEESRLRTRGETEEAMKINDKRMANVRSGTPQYAFVAFHRSLLYSLSGDVENEKKYLILSAISDIQSAIRDNASITMLADMLYKEGDLDRAYKYVKYSLNNVSKYNTRLRSSEIIDIQKIIDEAYYSKSAVQREKLRLFLILISVLSALLAALEFLLYRQMRRYAAISWRLEDTNAELTALNGMLHEMNTELQKVNLDVMEANYIKEKYISYFLSMCSKYIDKMDAFRRQADKKMRDRQYEELNHITRNINLKENELKELHANFDTMFIHIFPDFIEKFNSLLLPEEQIVLKKGETLNVELRIYALIRLGIDDSCKIADFLGYSVNTIYNYRTKVKNKARIAREDFESTVKKIGTFSRE